MKSARHVARRLAKDLLNNMRDRRGFKTDEVDAQTMRKWFDEWTNKIEKVLVARAELPKNEGIYIDHDD